MPRAHLNHCDVERTGPIRLQKPVPGQVVGDLLGRDLQAEEGVDAGEVAAQRGGAGGVQPAVAAARAAHLEVALDVEPAERVAAGAAVLQQVREQPVLGDVGLEAGAVDDEVGVHLEHALLGLDPWSPCRPPSAGTTDSTVPITVRYQPSRRPRASCFCQSLRTGVLVPPIVL